IQDHQKHIVDLEHGRLPDPVAEAIRLILSRNDILKERLEKLEQSFGVFSIADDLIESQKEVVEDYFQGGGI
ncbi:MAG: hypothetical protein JSV74_00245, partial [Dehalococcoidia bacterium]